MGQTAIKFPAAVGQLLRQRRKEMGFTLRQVSDRLAERGERIPTSTLNRIERAQLDPGVRRLFLLLDLYRVPPHLVSDLVELEILAVPPHESKEGDLDSLLAEGLAHWKEGRVAEGLACFFAVRQYVPDTDEARVLRQHATLSFATAARELGKYRLARQIVDDLLCEPPDPSLAVRVLILASSLWRGSGSLRVATALIREAELLLEDDTPKHEAWVFHQKAKLLAEAGELTEADRALKRSVAAYRGLGDRYGRVRAMILKIGLLEKQGRLKAALRCARQALATSEAAGLDHTAVYGHLELGRLLVREGDFEAGLEALYAGLAKATLLRIRNAEFCAHYHLWKALEGHGDHERARFELRAASYFLQFIDERSPETEDVRRNAEDKGRGDPL